MKDPPAVKSGDFFEKIKNIGLNICTNENIFVTLHRNQEINTKTPAAGG